MPAAQVSLRHALGLAALAGRRVLAANFACLCLQGVVPLLGLLAMQYLLDAVAAGIGPAGRDAARADVAWAVLFAALVATFGSAVRVVAARVADRHARVVADACATRLQRHAVSLDWLQIEDPDHADLLHRASAEASQRPVRVVHNLAGLWLAVVNFLCLGGALATVAPWLPVVVGLAAAPLAWVRLRHAQASFAWQQRRTEAMREVGYASSLLVGRAAQKELRLLAAGEPLAARVARQRQELTDEQLQLGSRRSLHDAFAQVFASVAMFAAYLYLGWLALDGLLTLGGLLLQAQAVQRTQNGLRDGLLAWSGLREDRLFLGHVFAFLAMRPTITAPAVPTPVPVRPPRSIEFRGVHFAYPRATAPTLCGIDFALQPGERVALVGPNGAGKSTLVRLLARLCDPDRGSISYGGVDLRQFDPQAFRSRLSVFFQDAAPLEFTARDNLALGAPGLPDAALLAAADLVGIGERLRALPRGLDTRLGRGFHGAVEFSAGEWRKLLLARALVRPGELLVLDEPFAFLDPQSQQRLVSALAGERQRTVLIIDHRESALGFCDRALRCEGGRIVADGPAARVLAAVEPGRPG